MIYLNENKSISWKLSTMKFLSGCKIIKFVLLITLLILINAFENKIIAQQKDESEYSQKSVFIGGNFGLQFGTITLVDISPLVGFRLTNNLSLGIGFTYQYYKDKSYTEVYKTNMYGGRLFSSYWIVPEVFAHIEYEILNFDIPDSNDNLVRKNEAGFLVGGGYRQMIGPNMYSDLMILWNLNKSIYSPYTNPIYRLGISIGI